MKIKGNDKTVTKIVKPLTWDNWNPQAKEKSSNRLKKLEELSKREKKDLVIDSIEEIISLIHFGVPAYSKAEHGAVISVKMPPTMRDVLDGFVGDNKLLLRDRSNLIRMCIIIGCKTLAQIIHENPDSFKDMVSVFEILKQLGKIYRKKQLTDEISSHNHKIIEGDETAENKIKASGILNELEKLVKEL